MSAHPSAWHLQSLFLSVRLNRLRSHSLGYRIQKTLELFHPSLTLVLAHNFSLCLHHSESLFTYLPRINSLLFSLHMSSTLSGLIRHPSRSCVPEQSTRCATFFSSFFCSVCLCFHIENYKILKCGCPLKSSVPRCFLGWAEHLKKFLKNLTFFRKAQMTSTSWPTMKEKRRMEDGSFV